MKWVFLAFAVAVLSCGSVSCQDFDIYTFTQEWPPTFCMSKSCNYPSSIVTGWNIHGLWPSVRQGHDPEKCHEGRPFDVKSLLPILNRLKNAWANLEAYKDPSEFWSYEWKTHGRCALSNDITSTELKYFNVSLTLKDDLALEKALASHSIVPGDKVYNTQDIYDAIKQVYGVQGILRCASKSGQAYLSEIRICYDKQLTKVDCPSHDLEDLEDFVLRLFGKKVGTNPCPDGVIIPTVNSLWRDKMMKMTIV